MHAGERVAMVIGSCAPFECGPHTASEGFEAFLGRRFGRLSRFLPRDCDRRKWVWEFEARRTRASVR